MYPFGDFIRDLNVRKFWIKSSNVYQWASRMKFKSTPDRMHIQPNYGSRKNTGLLLEVFVC